MAVSPRVNAGWVGLTAPKWRRVAVGLTAPLERIESIALGCGSDYSKRKHELKEAAGADDQRFRVATKFRAGVTPERLLDAMVGKGGSLDVDEFRVVDHRFGVAASRDDLTGPGQLKIEPTGKSADLSFTRPGSSIEIRLPADTYFATLPGLEGNLYKIRVKAAFIELVTSELDSGEITVHIYSSSAKSFRETRALITLLSWLSEGPVEFSLDCPIGNLWHGKCSVASLDDGLYWRKFNEILESLLEIFPLDRWPDSRKFNIAELNENLGTIRDFTVALTEDDTLWTVGGAELESYFDTKVNSQTLFNVVYLDLGEVTLFALYSAAVKAVAVCDGSTELTLSRPKILGSWVLRGPARNNWAFMRAKTAAEWKRQPDCRLYTDLGEQPPGDTEVLA